MNTLLLGFIFLIPGIAAYQEFGKDAKLIPWGISACGLLAGANAFLVLGLINLQNLIRG